MSKTQVYVIRLFIDDKTPNSLRGSVESVSKAEIRMFTDGQNLIDILRCMAFSPVSGNSEEFPRSNRGNQQDKTQ